MAGPALRPPRLVARSSAGVLCLSTACIRNAAGISGLSPGAFPCLSAFPVWRSGLVPVFVLSGFLRKGHHSLVRALLRPLIFAPPHDALSVLAGSHPRPRAAPHPGSTPVQVRVDDAVPWRRQDSSGRGGQRRHACCNSRQSAGIWDMVRWPRFGRDRYWFHGSCAGWRVRRCLYRARISASHVSTAR